MPIYHDFSDFPDALYRFSIRQFTTHDILIFDAEMRCLHESPEAGVIRKKLIAGGNEAFWMWWLRFSVGFECLLKSVLLKHEISVFKKSSLTTKAPGGTKALRTMAAASVYNHVSSTHIVCKNNSWLASEIERLEIRHPREINTGTLGHAKQKLTALETKGAATTAEVIFLQDAAETLGDIRRNVDAHVFLKAQVGGNINGDLTNVYIPACNILFDLYARDPA